MRSSGWGGRGKGGFWGQFGRICGQLYIGTGKGANPDETRGAEAGNEYPQTAGWGHLTPPSNDGSKGGKVRRARDEKARASRGGQEGCNVRIPKVKGTSGYRTEASLNMIVSYLSFNSNSNIFFSQTTCDVHGDLREALDRDGIHDHHPKPPRHDDQRGGPGSGKTERRCDKKVDGYRF